MLCERSQLAHSEDRGRNARGVLGLARSVRDHDAPTTLLRVVSGLDGLGDGADLVDLEQQTVARLLLDSAVRLCQYRPGK